MRIRWQKRHIPLWERACSRRRRVSQHQYRMTQSDPFEQSPTGDHLSLEIMLFVCQAKLEA